MYELTEVLRRYYYLTKPGIVYGNALTVLAGFFLATTIHGFHLGAGVGVLFGTSLIIGSACVINNIIDRKIDARMERTKKRSLVTGRVSVQIAAVFGVALGIIGFIVLGALTNPVTFIIGVVAYVTYIVFYGIAKRRSEHGTLVGSIAGALPPVAGYTALTGRLDLAALILFVMMVCWQMAHFYAIAIYRRAEYARAKVPILTVVRGNKPALEQMIIYIVGFMLAAVNLTISGYTGATYAVTMVAISAIWLLRSLNAFNFKGKDLDDAARRLFRFSLIVNLVMCVMVAIGGYLA